MLAPSCLAGGATTPITVNRVVGSASEISIEPGGGGFDFIDSNFIIFDELGALSETRSSTLSIKDSIATGTGSQTSTFSTDGFCIESAIEGSSDNAGDLHICQTSPVSLAEYRFEVDEDTPFQFTGYLDATGGGNVVFRFDAAFGGPNIVLDFASGGDEITVNHTGSIPPGTYQLRIEASAYISAGQEQSAAFAIAGTFGAIPCPNDLDGSGAVDLGDILQVLSDWGPNPGVPADLDGDGLVGFADLLQVISTWGSCP